MKTIALFVTLCCISVSFAEQVSQSELVPVQGFELNRYLGRWFEIARLPNSFEKNMVKVTATYTMRDNGMVRVENAGERNGKATKAIGKAKFAGDQTVGYLKVSFFGPFYADYKIIALDTVGYRYAMVASSHKYLWILAREPNLEISIRDSLVEKARALGFATDNLYFTPQTHQER